MSSRRYLQSCLAFVSYLAMVSVARSAQDIAVLLDGCAVKGNRITVRYSVKNNGPFRVYLAQVNDGNDAHGFTSSGGMLYIASTAGIPMCRGDSHSCENNAIVDNVNELAYVDSHSSLRASATYLDGNQSRTDPSDTATVPTAFMIRKAASLESDVPGTAIRPPGRPFVLRASFGDIPLSQCR